MSSPEDDFWDEALPPLAPKWSAPLSIDGLGPIFTTNYDSECESCEAPILSGDDARADGHGGWIHATSECEKVARD